MCQWEYFELEAAHIGGDREGEWPSKGCRYRPDGNHESYTGYYGQFLAKLGLQGWELVSVLSDNRNWERYVFKRAIEEPKPVTM